MRFVTLARVYEAQTAGRDWHRYICRATFRLLQSDGLLQLVGSLSQKVKIQVEIRDHTIVVINRRDCFIRPLELIRIEWVWLVNRRVKELAGCSGATTGLLKEPHRLASLVLQLVRTQDLAVQRHIPQFLHIRLPGNIAGHQGP